MQPSLWIAKTGLEAQQTRMGVVSNNLANVSTTGFKRDRAHFEDLFYQTVRQPGAQTSEDSVLPSGLMRGTGVRVVSTEKLHVQGSVVQTGNSLDIAIEGRGYFQILRPDGGIGYSRDGSFKLDGQGQVVNSNGYLLQPNITIPPNALSITIGNNGVVSVLEPGNVAPTQVGTIQLADFVNPAGLQPSGQNLFLETVSSGAPQITEPGQNGVGSVYQGALESSNVNVVEEMVNMIETQRAYEINSKAISTSDAMLQRITQLG